MNEDEIKGCLEEAKTNIKEVIGKPVDKDDMELDANLQKTLVKSKQALAISRGILRKASHPIIFRIIHPNSGNPGRCRTAICRR